MEIKEYGYINEPRYCQTGDMVSLSINKKIFYSETLGESQYLSAWLYVESPEYTGYVVGDKKINKILSEKANS